MTAFIGRREFITLLGGAAVAWPLVAGAQQRERMRRIGSRPVLEPTIWFTRLHGRAPAWIAGVRVGPWTQCPARSVGPLLMWNSSENAAELVGIAQDVIVATGDFNTGPLQEATRTVPIVFALVLDPVGVGFVSNLARPGGNTTGFTNFEYGMTGKWPELLKQIAPAVTRGQSFVIPPYVAALDSWVDLRGLALLQLEATPLDVRNPTEIERAITAFSRSLTVA